MPQPGADRADVLQQPEDEDFRDVNLFCETDCCREESAAPPEILMKFQPGAQHYFPPRLWRAARLSAETLHTDLQTPDSSGNYSSVRNVQQCAGGKRSDGSREKPSYLIKRFCGGDGVGSQRDLMLVSVRKSSGRVQLRR
ncbi:uncharacterized protein V6R79_001518 [Siganus canaliculatus]